MPGPAIPLIIGVGARLLAGQAARQAAKQGAKQGAKQVAKKTAKPRTTKKTTAKKTTAKKTTAKKTTAKKTTVAVKRTPGYRAAQTPQWAKTYGKKKPSQITLKMSARDKAQTQRLQKLMKDKKAKANNKTKAAAGTAAVVGVTGGGVGAAVGYSRKPKRKNAVKDQYGKTSTTRFRK